MGCDSGRYKTSVVDKLRLNSDNRDVDRSVMVDRVTLNSGRETLKFKMGGLGVRFSMCQFVVFLTRN